MYTRFTRQFQLLLFVAVLAIPGILWFSFTEAATVIKPSVVINKNVRSTSDRFVTLTFKAPTTTTHMRIGNSRDEVAGADWRVFRPELKNWYLSEGSGRKTVYVEFRNRNYVDSAIYSDTIIYYLNQEGYLIIEGGDDETSSSLVSVEIGIPKNIRRMRVSNSLPMDTVAWRKPIATLRHRLDNGLGRKTIYAQFEYTEIDRNTGEYKQSNIFQDSIEVVDRAVKKPTFTINNGAKETKVPQVNLLFSYPSDIQSFRVSNTSTLNDGVWRTPRQAMPWTLENRSGIHTVYVEFYDRDKTTSTVRQTITYKPSVATLRPQPQAGTLTPGVVVKDARGQVLYFGRDRALHPMSQKVFESWFPSDASLASVSSGEIDRYGIGAPVCIRPGTWLVKFRGDARVFAVEYGCTLRHLRSETEANLLYGAGWPGRLVELSGTERTAYTIISTGSTVPGAKDFDGDGLDAESEQEYGSSDARTDSDNDAVSDYEEVVYWLTNPMRADTNGNGVSDGRDIMAGRSPTTGGKLSKLPKDSYHYPHGSLVQLGTNSYAHRAPSGFFTSLGRSTSEQFLLGNHQTRFSVKPKYRSAVEGSVRTQKNIDPLVALPSFFDGGVLQER